MKLFDTKLFGSLALALLSACSRDARAAAAAQTNAGWRHVLVIHSYHQGYPFTDNETRGIDEVFRAVSNRVEQFVVYMDAKRISVAGAGEALRGMLATRYGSVGIDGVLTADNDALAFAVSNRASLFPGVPLVFCGINDFSDDSLAGQTNLTGVVEDSDYEETIAAALRLVPGARKVVAISDRTTTGLAHEAALRRIKNQRGAEWNIEMLSMGDYPLDAFVARLRGLEKECVVLLLNHYQDGTGQALSHDESMGMILGACPVPIFIVNDMRLWPGVVGGKLISGVVQGRTAAGLLLQAMNGTPLTLLPMVRKSPNVWMFDHAGLRRWQISASQLPPGSQVVNLPDSHWRRYRKEVIGFAILTLGLTAIIIVLALNIARRKAVETALAASNRRFEVLFENARDAIFVADAGTGLILDLNSQAEKLVGLPRSRLIGRPHTDLHPADQRAKYEALFRAHLQETGASSVEAVVVTSDNRRVPVEINASITELSPGRKVIQGIFRDVAERRLLTERLRQAQKMEAVGLLAGGVAHDFNNLLTVIQGHLALLQEDAEVASRSHESLDEIKLAARRAAELTRQLLAFSRRQRMQTAPVDLNRTVDHLLRMLRRLIGEQITLETSHETAELWIEADIGMIEQVITNLTLNARDAMPNGGRVVIATSVAEVKAAEAGASPEARPGRYACLRICDNGTGMDTTMVKRIFEPFYTTKEVGRGTGLGLATVYGIVKQHRGWIDVESSPGHGSTFKVYLPLTEQRPAQGEMPPGAGWAGAEPRLTVLVAEDDPAVRTLLVKNLLEHGHAVLEAGSGHQALEIWREHTAAIGLLISDMVMPGEMSGYQLACRCRADRPDLPVMIVSGYSAETRFERPASEPPIGFLAKPFDTAALWTAIRECVNGSRAGA